MLPLKSIVFFIPVALIGMAKEKDITIILHNKNHEKAFYKVEEASSYNMLTHSNPENGYLFPDCFCEITRPFPCYRTIHIDTTNERTSYGHYEVTMIPVKPQEYIIELQEKILSDGRPAFDKMIPTKINLIDTLEITCKDELVITIDGKSHVLLPEKNY